MNWIAAPALHGLNSEVRAEARTAGAVDRQVRLLTLSNLLIDDDGRRSRWYNCRMPRALSIYLDALRFTAAMTVLVAHMTLPRFLGGTYRGAWAGSAVAAFFVLSGYVIRYVSAMKERALSDYAVSRMARIYSVALPAIALTMALDGIGVLMGSPKELPVYQYERLWKYLPVFLTFATDIGPFRERMLTNGPFWSLSYEVSYYMLFGAAFYLRGAHRFVLTAIIAAVVGPRVLLYMPMWLAGVVVYELHQRYNMNRLSARLLFALSVTFLVGLRLTGVDEAANHAINQALGSAAYLRNSQNFIVDGAAAAVVSLNIFAARYADFSGLLRFARPIQYLAGFTFAIYLAHTPLLDFWFFVLRPASAIGVAAWLAIVFACIWLFGQVSEARKGAWRRLFGRLITPRRADASSMSGESVRTPDHGGASPPRDPQAAPDSR